jgi:hypothetical protein
MARQPYFKLDQWVGKLYILTQFKGTRNRWIRKVRGEKYFAQWFIQSCGLFLMICLTFP